MATSLTRKGLVAASDKVILSARPALELVKLFTTDFTVDPAKKGNVVSVKVLNATAQNFAKGTYDYAHPTNGIKYADIRLANHKISGYGIDDLDDLDDELAPVFGQFAPTCGRAIGKAIVDAVAGLLTYSEADAQKTLSGSGLAKFAGIRALSESENLDPAECVVVLEPVSYAELIAALPASVIGNGGVVSSALVGAMLGFAAVVEGPNVSKQSAASANNGKGFIVPTGAIGVAGRYVRPVKGQGGDLLEAGYTIDDETGLVFGTRIVQESGTGDVIWSTDALFGAALMKQTIDGAANGAPGFMQLV